MSVMLLFTDRYIAIEIMGHETTDLSHIELMMTQCAAHGFEPFHVRSPSMGYLYNRYVHATYPAWHSY